MADNVDVQKDRYLTMAAVAEMLSCTERHVYDLIMEGSLVAIKVGSRAIRISELSLSEFIEKNKVNPEDLFDPDREKKKTVAPTRPVAKSLWMSK
ncbi:MAG: helix-turn-helix domain-containing protein [Syntrophus sp. (in: bacteria)]